MSWKQALRRPCSVKNRGSPRTIRGISALSAHGQLLRSDHSREDCAHALRAHVGLAQAFRLPRILPLGQYSNRAQPVKEDLSPRFAGEPFVAPAVLLQQPSPRQQVAGVEFPVRGDAAAAAQAEPPCVDVPNQVDSLLGVDSRAERT